MPRQRKVLRTEINLIDEMVEKNPQDIKLNEFGLCQVENKSPDRLKIPPINIEKI